MITVNGSGIRTPDSYRVNLEDIVKGERNAAGNMSIERIATKRKLELAWTYLVDTDMSTLLDAVKDVFFTVQYPDPETGALKSGTFYSGSKSTEGMTYVGAKMVWRSVKFNLIER